MILKALYDYYNRCDGLPKFGMEAKEIGFIIVLSREGKFLRIENLVENGNGKTFFVKKSPSNKTSQAIADYFYGTCDYLFGVKSKKDQKEERLKKTFKEFKSLINKAYSDNPNSVELAALNAFYSQDIQDIQSQVKSDPIWPIIEKKPLKKISFRINGDLEIIAEKQELLNLNDSSLQTADSKNKVICLMTGNRCIPTLVGTPINSIGGTNPKLISFQKDSGYDSYGKEQGENAPISKEAEFAYSTALKHLLDRDSRNRFSLSTATFVFWGSSDSEATKVTEEAFLMFIDDKKGTDPNANIESVQKVFNAIFSGLLKTSLTDRFYILGLKISTPGRISVCYWHETSLKDFAQKILQHFSDMEIIGIPNDHKSYMGQMDMLANTAYGNDKKNIIPNLPEAVVKSIFQGLPYPQTLFSACIRRIRAGQSVNRPRVAIIKAYLNRQKNNNKKIEVMLDKNNTNQGYLCGRLFAVLDKIQEEAKKINSIRERYMNAASATPSAVFTTILNLSVHHLESLPNEGRKVFFEKLKQEIIDKISADGFPAHLDLQDQGRFFVGYYHQRQDFFTKSNEENK